MIDYSSANSVLIKRSVRIAGHRTSVTLESPFWDELQAAARTRSLTLAQLIAEVDSKRVGNLSSALRLYVLDWVKKR